MNEILGMLSGGDLRSEGRAAEAAARVIAGPDLLPELLEGLTCDDRLIRARTCMCIEVLSRTHPSMLEPHADDLILAAERETVAQARWHLAETFGNLSLDEAQCERLVAILLPYLEDRSKIVAYCAVLALGAVGGKTTRRSEIEAELEVRAAAGKSMAKAVRRARELLDRNDPT